MVLRVPVYMVRRRGKKLVKFQLEMIDYLTGELKAYAEDSERKALFMEGA